MHTRRLIGLFAVLLAIGSVAMAQVPDVRISEIHYDNTGTDAGEAIEVSGPTGTDLTGWRVVLYNGSNSAAYNTVALSGTLPATCGTRGVQVLNYPVNGIQNGGSGAAMDSPDAIALVDASNTVVEFLSYEGVLTAVDGPAVGLVSTDIGVRELGTEPVGLSLARNAAGVWSGPAAATFGACNDDGSVEPPAEVVSVSVTPLSGSVTVGATFTFAASALDAGGVVVPGTAVTWTSSDVAIATISATGVATGVAQGAVTVTATAPNGVSGSAALQVNAPPTGTPAIRINEIHYDNVGTDTGEAIEIEGPAGANIAGVSIVLYNGNGGASYNTATLTGTLPATCGDRGVVVVTYPQDGLQNGSPDGIALVGAGGQVIEFLSYEGTFPASNGPAAGVMSTDIVASQTNAALGLSLQRNSSNQWQSATSTFNACNTDGGPPPGGNTISFSGRTPSEPALPVGFQDQLFATVRDGNNVVVQTTITWTSETPALANIDANGVMTALGEGTAIVRATAADGVTTATYSLPTRVAMAGTTAEYAGNTEFGEPQDSDASDDFIVRYPQYTASYNAARGTPNWVSYDLDATHFGPEDRCECFTSDPALPASFPVLTTADYTGSGAFHGYGIDRGHLTRSFDRTTGSLDNAVTYYFSNIVPQAADMNQGPWAILENELGDLARFQDREVYIITGVAGNIGTLKNEGRVVIPASTWKVAVILPRNEGLDDIVDYRDVQVIAVNMPNQAGIRNVPWQTYATTVDAIEALTGYDLLALLPDNVEIAVESNTQPPIANLTSPAAAVESETVSFSAAGSIDPDGTIASYEWSFGDGGSAQGSDVTYTFAQSGVYFVSVLLTDSNGLTTTASATLTVDNVAPELGDFAGATLVAGETYTVSGSFTDPGADTWTVSIDWGDGGVTSEAVLAARSFSLSHVYATAGVYTVSVTISDGEGSSTRTQTVTVTAVPASSLSAAKAQVDQLLAAGKLSAAAAASLKVQLTLAERLLANGNTTLAAVTLRAILVQIDVLVALTPLQASDVTALRAAIRSAIP